MLDELVRTFPAAGGKSGLVVGVTQGGRASVIGTGHVGDLNSPPPRGDTLFEIGSVSKVLTTSLLAVACAEGQLSLDDSVCDVLPQLAHWSSHLKLRHLATHTSGLASMPPNVVGSMLRNRRNPYAAYSHAHLLRYLARYQPREHLPAPVAYSNLGLALVGAIVAQRLGMTYESALADRLGRPLEMRDTGISLTADQQARLAAPHTAQGKPASNWDLPAFAGAGGLRSSADDLLKFLAAHMGAAPAALRGALAASHSVYSVEFRPRSGLQKLVAAALKKSPDVRYRRGMALGWNVGRLHAADLPVLWHHGATGGYRAFAGFVTDTNTAAVVLANSGLGLAGAIANTTATDDLGFAVLERLHR